MICQQVFLLENDGCLESIKYHGQLHPNQKEKC